MPEFDSTVEYRDAPGFPGYKVGSDGSVWSCWRSVGNGRGWRVEVGEWHRLRPGRSAGGHLFVNLRGNTLRRVHRLVLEAFVGPCPEGMECCHSDGDPANNHRTNLRWGTRSSNIADRVRHGTQRRGQATYNAKLTAETIRQAREDVAGGATIKSLAAQLGVNRRTLARAVCGQTWRHI